MDTDKLKNHELISKLQAVLNSTNEEREMQEQVQTDRDGELLPDASDEKSEGKPQQDRS